MKEEIIEIYQHSEAINNLERLFDKVTYENYLPEKLKGDSHSYSSNCIYTCQMGDKSYELRHHDVIMVFDWGIKIFKFDNVIYF